MTVLDMVIRTMKKGEYATHYMKGKSNFFLRNNEDFYHLDKVTKGCTATVVAGTEEGEMFVPLTKNQLITEFAADLVMEDNTYKKRLFEALAKLNESEWEVLEKLADSLIKKD